VKSVKSIKWIDHVQYLTIDVVLPYGEILGIDAIMDYLWQNTPHWVEQNPERIRWCILDSRTQPEGTRFRTLVVMPPPMDFTHWETSDGVFPVELQLVAQWQSITNSSVVVLQNSNTVLRLVWAQGMLMGAFQEVLPADSTDWIKSRDLAFQDFLQTDSVYKEFAPYTLQRAENKKPSALMEVVEWMWLLNLQSTKEQKQRQVRLLASSLMQGALWSLPVILLLSIALWFWSHTGEQQWGQAQQSAHAALQLQEKYTQLQDSVGKLVQHLDDLGAGAHSPLDLQAWFQELRQVLGTESSLEYIHGELQVGTGMLWRLVSSHPSWDSADLYAKQIQVLPGVQSVKIEGRKAVANGRIQVRLEVYR